MTTVNVREHFLNHVIGYGFTIVTGLGLVVWYATVAYLDTRHVLNAQHETFIQSYQTNEIDGQLREVRRDLSKARREKRRFEAYLATDPEGALAAARQQTVNELDDEVSELSEELELLQRKRGT